MFRSLLIPLDGSPQSAIALTAARRIADPVATVTLLEVVPPESKAAWNQAVCYLEPIAAELKEVWPNVVTTVRTGEPAAEIVAEADLRQADLIVMATHARAPRSIMALTSVSERVLNSGSCPVLLVRPGGIRSVRLRTILVPVDGSPGGSLALAAAVGLARQHAARLLLLEVVVPFEATGMSAGGAIDPEWQRLSEQRAWMYIAGVAERLRESGIAAEGLVARGEVAAEIVRFASQAQVDLIAMSTHAVPGPARGYLGSVAAAVVRTGERPVLLVRREPPAGEVQPAAVGSEPVAAGRF
jgi:nucleotide-binding universal stress UspA family protein